MLLINAPLAVATVLMTVRYVRSEARASTGEGGIDAIGTALLSVVLAGVVFGLSQSQPWGWSSPGVLLPLAAAVAAASAFVAWERRTPNPLVDFALLRRRNYVGGSVSQLLSGMAEIGLVAGFVLLAASGVALAVAVGSDEYVALLPGLILYGIGLALVLTVNDPVSIDMIDDRDQGQASGVSATAEQFGGALGIAVLYSIFHSSYVDRLYSDIDASALPDLTASSGERLKDALQGAEATGLHPFTFDTDFRAYLEIARDASNHGYEVTFLAVAVIALLGALAVAWLVRPDAPAAAE